jgi:pilus assembly protein CpaE
MASPKTGTSAGTAPAGKRLALVVQSTGVSDTLLNDLLEPRGFAPVMLVGSVGELVTRMRQLQPAFVVTPVTGDSSDAAFNELAAELRRQPGCTAIGTAPVKDADLVLAALRAGVLEFLVTPATPEELRTSVARVLLLNSGAAQGQIYTLYSAKGGLGTSTIAASLAWELAHRNGQQGVALVDFTTTGGGMRVMLNMNPLYDLGNIASQTDRIDRDFVRSVMVPNADGVSILPAAEEVDAADTLDITTAGRLFDVLRQDYAYTVVDTDHHFAEPTIAALDAADKIVLVTQLDVSALRSTQRTLGVLSRLGYPAEKIILLANRRSERDRIALEDAEQVLRRSVGISLPNDYLACADAITMGTFVQRHAPASPLVGAFATMANLLTGVEATSRPAAPPRPDGPRLLRLFGLR